MKIFDKICIGGFRRLHDVKLELQPLNVVIGANGCGKTSLLDAFSLIAASASGRLQETMSEIGGIEANLSDLAGERANSLAFNVSMSVRLPVSFSAYDRFRYSIELRPRGVGYEIVGDTLTEDRHFNSENGIAHVFSSRGRVRYLSEEGGKRETIRPNWDYQSNESALSQVPKTFQIPEDFRKRLASLTHCHVLDVGPRAPIRLPQPMRVVQLPGHNGEDLISCLYNLRETNSDRFDAIEATLRAGFPEFERLNFPPVAAGTLAMTWKDRTSKHPFYLHQLSEGTLRFLWLVTLLHSPGLTAVTMIDEPEVSLHPELLALLTDLFREASQRTQLIVATHADRLIRFLKPAEVLTIDIGEDGAARFTRADELDLDKWLEEYTLDEVWRMGRIGGRP